MTTPREPRTAQSYHARIAFDPAAAAAIVACAMATFLGVGGLVSGRASTAIVLFASQGSLLVAALVAAIVWARVTDDDRPWPRLVGLRVPRARFVLAAVLIGASTWYLNLWLVKLVGVEPPPALAQVVEHSVLPIMLLALAVLPPIAEELVFRGILARALATRFPAIAAIAISAALFSFYHLSLVQAAPTFVLGCALGWLALRSDSIAPTIVLHATNNTIAVVLARGELPQVTPVIEAHPTIMLIGCCTATATGLVLIATARSR